MRKRLMILAPGLSEIGGAAKRSNLLLKELADRGWEIRVITRAGALSRFSYRRDGRMKILEVPGWGRRRLGAALFICVALPLSIAWGRHATVVVAIQLFSQATVAGISSILLKTPFIVLGTISGASSEVDYVLGSRSSSVRRNLFRRASRLVAQTDQMASEMSRLVEPEKITVIPSPLEAARPRPLQGRPWAMFAGRLGAYKNLDRLLIAWQTIIEEIPDARLWLVGTGGNHLSVESELRKTVNNDKRLSETVTFTGWVKDIESYFHDCDVFVLPSLSEGMSNALIEACGYRRIVVASDIEPNRAVLGDDYPLLFRAEDPAALASVLLTAFLSQETRRLALSRIESRLEMFSLDRVVDQLEAVIEHAAHSSRN